MDSSYDGNQPLSGIDPLQMQLKHEDAYQQQQRQGQVPDQLNYTYTRNDHSGDGYNSQPPQPYPSIFDPQSSDNSLASNHSTPPTNDEYASSPSSIWGSPFQIIPSYKSRPMHNRYHFGRRSSYVLPLRDSSESDRPSKRARSDYADDFPDRDPEADDASARQEQDPKTNQQLYSGQISRSSEPDKPSKRARIDFGDFRGGEPKADGASAQQEQKDPSTKPGACTRCKNLKVRCVYRSDTEPCKRCLDGGHECIIPGRKKQRTPPKREHLLNQIREQAGQIQSLMAKLEEVSKRPAPLNTSISDVFISRSSAVLPPSPVSDSDVDGPSLETDRAAEDWITKAKASFAEFGDLMGITGSDVQKGYLSERDPEAYDSVETTDNQNAGFYIAVEPGELDEEEERLMLARRSARRKKSSSPSAGSVGRRISVDVLASLGIRGQQSDVFSGQGGGVRGGPAGKRPSSLDQFRLRPPRLRFDGATSTGNRTKNQEEGLGLSEHTTSTNTSIENTFLHTHKLHKAKKSSCIHATYDPHQADKWIEENYHLGLLLHIREQGIRGPYACMLSPPSTSERDGEGEALVLFVHPKTNVEFVAKELAQVSSFPVIVRPIGEDPLLTMGGSAAERELEKYPQICTLQQSQPHGNSKQGSSSKGGSSKGDDDRSEGGADGEENGNEGGNNGGRDGARSGGDGDGGPPEGGEKGGRAPNHEIQHGTSVTLQMSPAGAVPSKLRIRTSVKFYPEPNSRPHGVSTNYNGDIDCHVRIKVDSNDSIRVDYSVSNISCITKYDEDIYLEEEQYLSLGYDPPSEENMPVHHPRASARVSPERALSAGQGFSHTSISAGGNVTIGQNALASSSSSPIPAPALVRSNSSRDWFVEEQTAPEGGIDHSLIRRTINVVIKRAPGLKRDRERDTKGGCINVEYGMRVAVNPEVQDPPLVSFVQRQQTLCWIETPSSKAKVKGVLVFSSHFLPDIRTKIRHWFEATRVISLENSNTGGTQAQAGPSSTQGIHTRGDEQSYALASAVQPDVISPSTSQWLLANSFSSLFPRFYSSAGSDTGSGSQHSERSTNAISVPIRLLPVNNHILIGWRRNEHRGEHPSQWISPVWPMLCPRLNCVEGQCGSDIKGKLNYVWKVRWEHGLSDGSEGDGDDDGGREDG